MNCPVCKSAMIILELNDVEIDYCTECGGIWLDEGELEALIEDSQAKDELLKSFKNTESSERPYKCPRCSRKMEKITAGSGILIDRCRKLHGLWFDKGELEEIICQGSLSDTRVTEFLRDMFKGGNT